MKKKVTTEDLAAMIQKGFMETAKKKDVDGRFDGVDERLGNLGSDVSYLKDRVAEIGRTLNNHEEILEEHSEELKWIHKKIDELTDPRSNKHAVTYKEFSELELRVATLEKRVAAKV